MGSPRILAFSGSPSRVSLNARFVCIAAGGAEAAGAEVTHAHLADYELPVFSTDLEQRTGMPENARAFKQLMMDHDGFLVASPENNGSVTAALKNTVDWVSRSGDGQDGRAAFRGKTGAFISASDGQFGAVRSLDHCRYLFGRLGVTVIPQMYPLGHADRVVGEDGTIADEKIRARAEAVGRALAEALRRG